MGKTSLDIKKFENLGKERNRIIRYSFTDAIKFDYDINKLAHVRHPNSIVVVVSHVKNETMDTKTFTLKAKDGKLPPFKAGQYVVLDVRKNDITYKRCYSISSSPSNLDSYDLTVKRVRNGIVSNYLLNEVKEGMEFIIHGPFGEFTYNFLRDQNDVLALAGGSGITPFVAMARAINDRLEDFNLTIVYGERSAKDLVFKDVLDELAKSNDKIKVRYVLDEDTGFITEDIIKEYELGKYSYFVCGPIHFYHYLNEIFKKLEIPNKYIRHDIYKENELDLHHIRHSLTVLTNDEELKVDCYEDESLSKALEEANVKAPRKCLVGVCGYCRSKLIDGKVRTDDTSLREADKDYNYIHLCVSYPLTDVTIKLCK